MLYATKKLQKTNLYSQHSKLKDLYYKTSLKKEAKQQSYLQKFIFANEESGECQSINYSFENNYKKYTKSIEQKVYAIEELSREKSLVPVFVTLTLPSNYHPFVSMQYKDKRLYRDINSSFNFEYLEDSILSGYKRLTEIYRTLYKRVKNDVSNLLYVKVVEIHKTFIPHIHVLFYLKQNEIKILEKKYKKIVKEFELNQCDFNHIKIKEVKEKRVKKDISKASKYLMKYVTKSLKSGEDFFQARVLDGWKRINKIRLITSSNLDLSLSDYRIIYYNIEKSLEDKILTKAKNKGQSLFYYILKNICIVKIVKQNNKSILKQYNKLESSHLILFKTIKKSKAKGVTQSKIENLTIFYKNNLVYKKLKYIKIQNEV